MHFLGGSVAGEVQGDYLTQVGHREADTPPLGMLDCGSQRRKVDSMKALWELGLWQGSALGEHNRAAFPGIASDSLAHRSQSPRSVSCWYLLSP